MRLSFHGHLATTTTTTMLPQHGAHSHPGYLEGLKPKRGFAFARFSRLSAATQPTASSLQQSTIFLLKKRIIHSGFAGKIFFLKVFQAFFGGT